MRFVLCYSRSNPLLNLSVIRSPYDNTKRFRIRKTSCAITVIELMTLFYVRIQDMSRRKQRNPKSIVTTGEEELKMEPQEESDEDSRELRCGIFPWTIESEDCLPVCSITAIGGKGQLMVLWTGMILPDPDPAFDTDMTQKNQAKNKRIMK
jgi:hypothetical protein